ncbi:MAG: hypothetical protein LBD52_04205 [Prevotellaceae bacterium]|jgi:hypothetical protein|nr:hypothetical protein [Prevotellaceae bacterium]
MSTSRSTLNRPDAEFLAKANNINEQCHLHGPEWDIEPPRLTQFNTLLAAANTAYEANNHESTKNAITSAHKKSTFGELKHFMGPFIDYLEVNTNVPDEALAFMGLRSREHHVHQPLPRPTEAPVISVRRQHDEITVYAARPEQDHPTAGVAPAHYHGFALRYRVDGEERYETVMSSRLHHTLFFERADEGKRILLSAAWVNPRLETGPWCVETSEVIG